MVELPLEADSVGIDSLHPHKKEPCRLFFCWEKTPLKMTTDRKKHRKGYPQVGLASFLPIFEPKAPSK